jgi:AbrB family looped-hinge helix DNA binding protein
MATTTLTSKGQITLPKQVRERLSLKKGDRLRVEVGPDGSVILGREQRPPLDSVCGLLRHLARRRPVSIEQMRKAVRQRARRKHGPSVA